MAVIIIIIVVLILLSPDKEEASTNVIAFGIEALITVALFGVNPILGIIVGYLFLRSWGKQ